MTPVAQQTKMRMTKNSPAMTPQPAAKGQSADLHRRIHAGYIRLLHTILQTPVAPRRRAPRGEGERTPKSQVRGRCAEVRGSKFEVQGLKLKARPSSARQPAAADYLSRFLCAGFAVVLMATGCAGPRPLKGGKAVTTRKPAGVDRADPCARREPCTGDEADPGDREGAHLHRARRLTHRPIPAARCLPQRNYQPSTLNLSTCHPQLSTLNPQPPSS